MLGLMAAVTDRFTGRSWNRTQKEKIIQTALDFPLDHVVERYRQDEEVAEDYAREIERELRRYLILCALYPHPRIPMHGPVDRLWHVFLTFTRDYAAFCQAVAGRFIHHRPEAQGADSQHGTRRFVRLYQQTFGHVPPAELWPATIRIGSRRHWRYATCSSCSGVFGDAGNGCSGSGCGGGCGGD